MLQESLYYTNDRLYLTLLSEYAGPLSDDQEKAIRLAYQYLDLNDPPVAQSLLAK